MVIRFEDSGYIKDDEAEKIDYAKMLKEMQGSEKEINDERQKEGYPAIHIVGWAASPRYDRPTHKLYWAKEIQFSGEKEHTLNYNIRALGRRGVLILNVISGMNQFDTIDKSIPDILAMVDFKEGHRYADFNPSIDKVAGYGIAALVAGGIAAKTGLLKLIWVGLLAGKKFIIIGALAAWAAVKKFFGFKEKPPGNPPGQIPS